MAAGAGKFEEFSATRVYEMKENAVDEDFSKSNIGSHLEKIGWLIIISAAIIIGLYAYTFSNLPMNEDPSRWGTFGDFVGGLLNPLVSTCTFIVAVRVFQLQKIETRMTRDALEGSEKAMQAQAKIAEQQRSEQRFFDLLNIYQESLRAFAIEGFSGKAALTRWGDISTGLSACKQFLKNGGIHYLSGINIDIKKEDVIEKIRNSWENSSSIFDHYFRTMGSIFREIENLLKDDHWRYAKLFRAQLSRDEVNLLAFNVLLDANGEKMRPLVAKYGLLKYLPISPLRTYAEQKLDPLCFGRKWAAAHSAMSSEETQPC